MGGARELPVTLQRRARLAKPGVRGQLRDPAAARRMPGRAHGPLSDREADAAAFEEWRSLLFGIAYRMLGSAADAEDVVQDACVRWLRRGDEPVRSVRAYLVTVVTRLCLDQLGSARAATGDLCRAVAARARRRGRNLGGRTGRLVVARVLGAARGADAARARRLPAPRRLRVLLRRGGALAEPRRRPPADSSVPGRASTSRRGASASTPTCTTAASSPTDSWPPARRVT